MHTAIEWNKILTTLPKTKFGSQYIAQNNSLLGIKNDTLKCTQEATYSATILLMKQWNLQMGWSPADLNKLYIYTNLITHQKKMRNENGHHNKGSLLSRQYRMTKWVTITELAACGMC